VNLEDGQQMLVVYICYKIADVTALSGSFNFLGCETEQPFPSISFLPNIYISRCFEKNIKMVLDLTQRKQLIWKIEIQTEASASLIINCSGSVL
jgi:hypothetical protein